MDRGSRIREVVHEDRLDARRDGPDRGAGDAHAAHRLIRHETDPQDGSHLVVIRGEGIEIAALDRKDAREMRRDDPRPVLAVVGRALLRQVREAELAGFVLALGGHEDDAFVHRERHAAPPQVGLDRVEERLVRAPVLERRPVRERRLSAAEDASKEAHRHSLPGPLEVARTESARRRLPGHASPVP